MGLTSVRLSDDLEAPLDSLSQNLHRSKNYLINQAVKEFLQRQEMEDARWMDTLAALESAKAGKFIHSDDVESWLRSWGQSEEKPTPK